MHILENGIILIPIDFSKQSLNVLPYPIEIAKHSNCSLHIMYVYAEKQEHSEDELKNTIEATFKSSGLKYSYSIKKGDIYEESDKKAEELNCSLIVVGIEPHVRFRSFMGKSSSSKFISKAPCPVITIKSKTFNPAIKNICAPLDLTLESREKIPSVVQLALMYKADIRLVSVFDPSDSHYENKLLPYLNQVKRYIKEKNVNCTNKSIPSKDPVNAIIDYALKNNCDILVQMNKRDVGFGEMFSGSDSQKMVEISSLPVLTINPMKRKNMPLSY
ncbi:MAG: universal stress protein [Bacteroidetes bacterium]|nr:universal stress protein [Bacteroidota bacterium]